MHCRSHRTYLASRAGIPDETLVGCARQGDSTAWDALIDRYDGLVRARAARFFFPGADLDDVIQEGMVGLCKAVRDYRAERQVPFAAFAAVCIRRQILTALKTALRGKQRPLNTARSLDEPLPSNGHDGRTRLSSEATVEDGPDALVLREFELTRFAAWMRAALAPLEQAAVRGYLEGLHYGEIARLAGCNVKAVDNALQRVKRKLRQTELSLSVDSVPASRSTS